MPSRLWYLVAFVVLALGIGGAAWFGVSRFGELESRLTRVVVPGESVLDLAEAGTYTIFHETTGTVDGVVYSSADISGLRVALQSAETGETVPLRRPTANTSYDFGGSSAVGILAFTIDSPGRYRLRAAYDDGRAEPRAILSVTSGFVGRLVGMVLGAVGLVFGSLALAIAIGATTFSRRKKAAATT